MHSATAKRCPTGLTSFVLLARHDLGHHITLGLAFLAWHLSRHKPTCYLPPCACNIHMHYNYGIAVCVR